MKKISIEEFVNEMNHMAGNADDVDLEYEIIVELTSLYADMMFTNCGETVPFRVTNRGKIILEKDVN